jgi:hypothetical protein
MKLSLRSGTTIAAAAAALIISGALAPAAQAADEGKGHCVGANACKGKSDCKTASNECKGQNACKGKGFLAMTKADCDQVEGATFEPAS